MFINKLTLSGNYVQATELNSVGKKSLCPPEA